MEEKPFNDGNEKIFRAVRPKKLYWDSDGNITLAVFDLRSGENGVSFDRADGRSDKECCEYMHKKLDGKIVSLTVDQCLSTGNTDLKHTPSKKDTYHSELIYLTTNEKDLFRIKYQLAHAAKVEDF